MRAEEFPAIAGDADVLELGQPRHVEVFHRAAGQHIDLAGFKRNRAGGRVGDHVPVDFVEGRLALDVVVRILDQLDERALLPLLEHEGAGSDRGVVGRIGLVIGSLVDVLGNHRQRTDFEDAEERSERLLQREHHGGVVGGLDLVELHQVCAGTRMGLFQEIDREQHVGGRERLAVMPGDACSELEGVDLAVLADGPAVRQPRLRLQFRTVAQQALIDVARNHLRRAVLDDAEHQAGRFRLDHGIDDAAHFRVLRDGRCAQRARQGQPNQDLLQHAITLQDCVQDRLKDRLTGAFEMCG